MARGQRSVSSFTRKNRQGNTAVVVGAAVAAFGLVLAAVYLALDSSVEPQAPPVSVSVETPAQLAPTPLKPEIPSQPTAAEREVFVAEVPRENPVPQVPAQDPPAIPPQESTRDLVKAHAEAGEFGLAMDLAQTIADVQERAALLRIVADTQIAAGELDGAMHAIRRIPIPELRGQAQGERARQQSLSGGGSMANFGPLMNLIQNETSGPWSDVDGTGGTMSQYQTGVRVDPNGQLALLSRQDFEGRLDDLGIKAREADLNEDMAQKSPMRVVSVTRLEAEIARRLELGQPVLATMKHLAGLQAIQYVFVDPETREIMVAGPAEAWKYNDAGIPVGTSTGRPTMQLDDFVTVMRTFSPTGGQFFDCLIVPRKEGLKKLSDFAAQSNARGPLGPGAAARNNFAKKCQEELGLQDAVFHGIPLDSRVARVILEADYRMKLIGIDKLDAGPNIPSYFDLLTPQAIQKNPPRLMALRWWMTMKYNAVLHSPSRTVFEIQGPSVQCLSENELVEKDGNRIHTGKTDPLNRLFAENFTQHYAELAERDLVFADLKNVFDLSLVAALMLRERLITDTNRGYGVFAEGGAYETTKFEPPKSVMSVVNCKVYPGHEVIAQVAGGVRGDLLAVLKNDQIYRESERLDNLKTQAPNLPAGRWWWDVK